jgi:hypothetical protein
VFTSSSATGSVTTKVPFMDRSLWSISRFGRGARSLRPTVLRPGPIDNACDEKQRSVCDGEQSPFVGYAFENVAPLFRKRNPGPDEKSLHRLGDEHLGGAGDVADTSGDVDGECAMSSPRSSISPV